MGSHFDQFEIVRLIPFHLFGNLDLSFTNSTLFMLFAVSFFYFLYLTNIKYSLIIPGRWQSIIELIYETIHSTVKDNVGTDGTKFFAFILTLFIFIATMNLFGLIPYTFSPTSHFAVTFGLSLSIFIAVLIIGIAKYKLNYVSMFMPAGAPLGLGPFLVLIEFISHFAKALSLGLRLAANITAGHLLFTILSVFTWNFLTAGGLIAIGALLPFSIGLFITILEIAVAVIQAYVFCLLTIIYLGESLHLH